MSYLLSLNNAAAGGTTYRVNGKGKLDRHVFQRDPKLHNRHILRIQDADWPAIRDDIFFEGQPAVIAVDYEIDPGAADKAATEPLNARIVELDALVKEKDGQLKSAFETLNETRRELSEARLGANGITADQIAFLRERDAMIDILGPYADGNETPIEALTRLCRGATIPAEDLPEPEPPPQPPKPPAADASAGPKIYGVQALGKMKLDRLQSIAGALNIPAPHEIKPTAKLIQAILLAQEALLQTAG